VSEERGIEAKLPAGATSKPFTVGLRLEMKDGWHTYWKNAGESGAPTKITWKLPEGFTAGPIQWPTPSLIVVPPVVSYGYEKDVLLLTEITPPPHINGKSVKLMAKVDWLECKEVCIPGKANVELTLPVLDHPVPPDPALRTLFDSWRAKLPVEDPRWKMSATRAADKIFLRVRLPEGFHQKISQPIFFAEDPNVIDYSAPEEVSDDNSTVTLALKISDAAQEETLTRLHGVLVTGDKSLIVDEPLKLGAAPLQPTAIWTALLFAFLGGLLLNLMPCVLPVLSIKILGFVQHAAGHKKEVLKQGVAFSVGVLVSFWVLAGALLILKAAGNQLGWGFQLQSPAFVFALAVLFLVLALDLFGLFEIGSSLVRLAGLTKNQRGVTASFFNGVLATVVATPCTAPFMGSALGVALTQPPHIAMAIFTSLGAGMAAPYLIFSANPTLLKFLPKPGPWMDTFKRFMGLLLLATVAWLVWVFVAIERKSAESMAGTSQSVGGLAWENYNAERVEELRNQGRIVFVDFTAAWCLTCQVNERVVFNSKSVKEKFRELNVALVRADWTSPNDKITQALEQFGRDGVPLYVVYKPNQKEPVILPTILTPGVVIEALTNKN
jgi:thiol:disulfide interchange protein DsbD